MTQSNQPETRGNLFKRAAAPAAAAVESFPMRVEGYDLRVVPPVVLGIRLDTGERVAVSLQQSDHPATAVAGQYNSYHSRPEIAEFAGATGEDKRNVRTVRGGTLFIERGKKIADNCYAARWITRASAAAGIAEVLMAPAYYSGASLDRHQKPSAYVELLFDKAIGDFLSDEMKIHLRYTPPFLVRTRAELRQSLVKYLNLGLEAGVRLRLQPPEVVKDGVKVKPSEVFDAMAVPWNDSKPSVERVDEFIALNLPDELDRQLANNELTMEVILYRRVFLGGGLAQDKHDRLLKEKARTESAIRAGKKPTAGKNAIFEQQYHRDWPTEDGYLCACKLYGKTSVSLQMGDPDAEGKRKVYIIHVGPMFQRNETFASLRDALSYAQTDNFAPEIVYTDFSVPKEAAPRPDPMPSDVPPPADMSSQESQNRRRFNSG